MVNSSQRRETRRSTRHTILQCDELTVWQVDWFPTKPSPKKVSVVSWNCFQIPQIEGMKPKHPKQVSVTFRKSIMPLVPVAWLLSNAPPSLVEVLSSGRWQLSVFCCYMFGMSYTYSIHPLPCIQFKVYQNTLRIHVQICGRYSLLLAAELCPQWQLNSTERASMDAGDKTPQCPHLSSHYFISIL